MATAVKFMDHSRYTLVDPGPETFNGILDNPKELVSSGIQFFGFQVLLYPMVTELDVLLPLIGMTESPTDTFTLTDDFSSLTFSTVVDKVAKVHTYTSCKVDKAIFRGQKGGKPVSLELHILALAMTEGSSFGSPTVPTKYAPYAFNTGTMNLLGTAYQFDRFALGIDNHCAVQHNNSEAPQSIQPTWRSINLGCSTPYTSTETSLLTTAIGSSRSDGGTGNVTMTYANFSTVFSFANMKWEATPPSVLGKGSEIRLDQMWTIYKSSTTAPLIVTHDATP